MMRFPWLLLPAALLCAAFSALPARSADPPPTVLVRADQAEGRLVPETLTNASLEAIYGQTVSPMADTAFAWVRATNALSYVRCYNWLGDGVPKSNPEWFSGCRVAEVGPGGKPVYRWDRLERVLDTLVASGVKPVIVCAGLPDALLEPPIHRNEGGAAVNRPRDYALYQDMIEQMFRRLVKTYGQNEVRTWYFEVWSQPDHEGSWETGRPGPFVDRTTPERVEPFTRLYDHFVAGATEVDEKLRLGGPGLAGDPSFLELFLEHCVRGKNAVTGKTGSRIDFVSWHRYGPVADIVRWNGELRGLVRQKFPELKDLRFLLSECGSGKIEGARANTSYEAARMAALLDQNARSGEGVDLIFRSGDLVADHFSGFRPLFSRVGENTIPLPAFQLYMFLSKMGGERVRTETPPGIGAVGARSAGKDQRASNQVLVYHYDPASPPGARPRKVRVEFTGLPSRLFRLPMRTYRIDPAAHGIYEAWLAAGRPDPAPKELGATLASRATLKPHSENPGLPVSDGRAVVELELHPNSVALVTLGVEPIYEGEVCARGRRIRQAEEDYAAAADLQRMGQYSRAVTAFRAIQQMYSDTFWAEVVAYTLVGLYELDLKAPLEARNVRQELMGIPLDETAQIRLLERLRVDLAREKDTAKVDAVTRQIAILENRLAGFRRWPLTRYYGQQ